MTDAQDTTPDVVEVQDEVTEAVPYESESARYSRLRKESKARAADTIKANDKAAQAAKKKALAKEPAQPELAAFQKRAKAIEANIAKDHAARQAEGSN